MLLLAVWFFLAAAESAQVSSVAVVSVSPVQHPTSCVSHTCPGQLSDAVGTICLSPYWTLASLVEIEMRSLCRLMIYKMFKSS